MKVIDMINIDISKAFKRIVSMVYYYEVLTSLGTSSDQKVPGPIFV